MADGSGEGSAPRSNPPAATPIDFALLGLAVAAVSTSAPLIRYAAAPSLAVSMWRNALAFPVLAPAALRRARPGPRERWLIAYAGLLLAAHFALWISSISYTSVASAAALVATQPAWSAVIDRVRGTPVARQVWAGIGVAVAGVVLLTGIDVSISSRAVFGDVLSLLGAGLAAAYVQVGAEVRRTVDTSVYAAGCYAVAALVLLPVCLVTGQPLVGYPAETWLAIAGLVVGAQLLGHTLFNRVLETFSPTTVSVSILFEVVGATLIAWAWFAETPPLAAIPAGVLIFGGILLVIRAGRRRPSEGEPCG